MDPQTHTLTLSTRGRGLNDITREVTDFVERLKVAAPGPRTGAITCFIRHTSASLVVQENADPAVLRDLARWMERLAPESDRYEHDAEGPDDMPSHVRAALTQTSISIPVVEGSLVLGTWQAIYLYEHRNRGHRREVVLLYVGR